MWVMCSKTGPEAPAASEGKNSTSQYWDFYWQKKEVKTHANGGGGGIFLKTVLSSHDSKMNDEKALKLHLPLR